MDSLLVELKCSSGEHNTYEVYMIHTNPAQVYMHKYTPWNSFDVWLHHSIIYIYIYIYIYKYVAM